MNNPLNLVSLCGALVLTLTAAQADIVMKQKSGTGAASTEVTMSIKGDMVRTDSGTENSVIINTVTGDMTSLMHEQKMCVVVKGADLKAAQAAQPTGDAKPVESKLESTGKTEKVGEYECEIYTLTANGVSSKLWLAKDYPNYAQFKKELAVMGKMSPGTQMPDLPGMAIKSETEVAGQKYTTELVSLSTDAVDEALFKAPADYKAPGQ